MNATTTAMKYRPSTQINGRSLDTIARKLARSIRSGYGVRKISETINTPCPAGGMYRNVATYIITDTDGMDIADTVFAVTEEPVLRQNVRPGDANTTSWDGRAWVYSHH